MQYTLDGRTWSFANVRLTGIGGSPGVGFYRLTVSLELSMDKLPEGHRVALIDVAGELEVRGSGTGPCYLGRLTRANAQQGLGQPSEHYANKAYPVLECELDSRRMEAIEALRLGGSLTFALRFSMDLLVGSTPATLSENLTLSVNQGTWIELLNQVGYKKVMLLEVPVPDPDREPELAEAVKDLAGAQTQLLLGHNREAVGCCRDVLEVLNKVLGDKDKLPPPDVQRLFVGSNKMTKAERLRVVRKALILFCHPARHRDEVEARIDWDREDAMAAISALAALLPLFPQMREPSVKGE